MATLEGIYRGVAVEWTKDKTDKGYPFLKIMFEIVAGEARGRRVSGRFFLHDKSLARSVEVARVCGWSGKRGSFEGMGSRDVQLDVRPEVNEQTGKAYAQVAFVNPVPTLGKERNPLSKQEEDLSWSEMCGEFVKQVEASASSKDG